MAVVVGAGPRPANEQAVDAGRAPQFEIRKIEVADVIDCITRGVQDFRRAPLYGMFFGAFYAIGGLHHRLGGFRAGLSLSRLSVRHGFCAVRAVRRGGDL